MAKKQKFKIGEQVFWLDPDGGLCSGWVTVTAYYAGDDSYYVEKADGGGVRAPAGELYHKDQIKSWSVDLQYTVESTYQMEAPDGDTAERIARRLHAGGEVPAHEEHLDPEVMGVHEC